ncbi:O-antigen ligase [Nocardioides exalbidus]|uniref:O-antigen ligase n=1 Tax=Nocardioides exalbidus TaxID=402596 RepID=A0A1H4LBH3_9ACTN|nr:O-antigen ligase family protein [Nocardioides exalbidus]SEB68077.1 O-antigen ligase [Nocardioides exalbidus]
MSRRIDSPWNLEDKTVTRADEVDRDIRVTDFALMAALPFRTTEVSGFPVNELAMAALVGLCLVRPARGGARLPAMAVVLIGGLLALMLYSGMANQIDWTRRVGHLVIISGVIWSLATGRVSLRSAGLGIATGLIAVIGLGVVGMATSSYAGRLTGYLGDPNAGAYFVAVLGVLAVFYSDPRWKVRLVVALPILAGLTLTYSRTGLLAGAFAAVWVLLGRRLGVAGGGVFAFGLVWLVGNIPDSITTFGPFSNRSGSDALRERIIAQERVQIADAPWYGHGPGTAKVRIQDLDFFFHNSYLATRQEGGWGALVLVLGLMAFAFLRLSRQSRRGDLYAAGAQAAIIAVAVMGITLGEVLLDTPMAIAVGFALAQATRASVVEDGPDG